MSSSKLQKFDGMSRWLLRLLCSIATLNQWKIRDNVTSYKRVWPALHQKIALAICWGFIYYLEICLTYSSNCANFQMNYQMTNNRTNNLQIARLVTGKVQNICSLLDCRKRRNKRKRCRGLLILASSVVSNWATFKSSFARRPILAQTMKPFLENGHPWTLLCLFSVFFKQRMQILQQINVHPVNGAGIWTHALLIMSLLL